MNFVQGFQYDRGFCYTVELVVDELILMMSNENSNGIKTEQMFYTDTNDAGELVKRKYASGADRDEMLENVLGYAFQVSDSPLLIPALTNFLA